MNANHRTTRPSLESLEARLAPSASPVTVTNNFDSATRSQSRPLLTYVSADGAGLRIEGTDFDDRVTVRAVADRSGAYHLHVDVTVALKGLVLKREEFDVAVGGFKQPLIVFRGKGNDDSFRFYPLTTGQQTATFNIYANGGAGKDELYGSRGSDVLIGGGDNDFLRGEGGNDVIFGNDGNDVLEGGPGSDFLFGGKGKDGLTGDGGVSLYQGNPGEGDGDDYLDGGIDGVSDSLTGGTGKNVYVFDPAPARGNGNTATPGSNLDTPFLVTSRGERYVIVNASAESAVDLTFATLTTRAAVARLTDGKGVRFFDDAAADRLAAIARQFGGVR